MQYAWILRIASRIAQQARVVAIETFHCIHHLEKGDAGRRPSQTYAAVWSLVRFHQSGLCQFLHYFSEEKMGKTDFLGDFANPDIGGGVGFRQEQTGLKRIF
jgi:hypothetical protein